MGLRLKVSLVFLAALLVYVPVFYFGATKSFSELANDQMVKHAQTFCLMLAERTAEFSREYPGESAGFEQELAREFGRAVRIAQRSGVFSVVKILLLRGDYRAQCAYPASEAGKSYPDEDVIETFERKGLHSAIEREADEGEAEIDVLSHVALADGSARVIEVKLSFSETERLLKVRYRKIQIVAVATATLSFASLLAFLLVVVGGSVIAPATRLSRAMDEVGRGNLDVGVPVRSRDEFGQMAARFNAMIVDLKEKLQLSTYVSGATRAAVRQGVAEGTRFHAPRRRKTTIFFSDVRGFTAFSEKRDPGEVIGLLNRIFALQAGIIRAKGGDIDKFVGDQTMAIFEDGARAIEAGLEIQAVVTAHESELCGMQLGIGILEGEVVAGDLGSEEMKNFTVIGDAVNTAVRIQDAAAGGEVLLCEMLARETRIQKRFACEKKGDLLLKGKALPLGVWVVKGRREA